MLLLMYIYYDIPAFEISIFVGKFYIDPIISDYSSIQEIQPHFPYHDMIISAFSMSIHSGKAQDFLLTRWSHSFQGDIGSLANVSLHETRVCPQGGSHMAPVITYLEKFDLTHIDSHAITTLPQGHSELLIVNIGSFSKI